MEFLRKHAPVIVGCIIAFVLHVVVAPSITIYYVQPNLLFAFCLALAIVRPGNSAIAAAFALGLAGSLIGTSPVGLMAAVLVLVTYVLARLFAVMDNSSLGLVIVGLALGVLLCEFLYAFLLVQFGLDLSLFSLLIYRVLPCALYDLVAAFVFYMLAHRFIGPEAAAPVIPVAQMR